jgi:coiled-coil and C2 domain-containing protein 2A
MEEKGDDGRTYKLTVSVGQLYFSHHHLFSQEHVTASKLIGAYKHFMSKREQNRPRVLREKLNALRSLRSSLEQTMSKSRGRDTQDRLSQCRRDIFQTLFEKKGEEEMEFALFKDISRLWTDLKQIRVEQGYTSTTTKMVFEIEPCDAEREKIERAKDIEDEVLYRREEHENLIMQYKKAVKEYEKKIRRLRRRHARSTGGDQYSSEINLLADEVPAPQKPLPFSEEDVRAEIVRSYLETVPPPESSRLVPKLEAMVVTPKQQCESGEQQRREDVGAMKYRLSVLVNGKEAARSSDWHLDQHLFVVRFKEIFGVKVRRWPSSLSLQVRETGSLGSHVLSEIYLPVPDGKETSANSLQQYQFSDCTTVSYLHNAVGGNVAEDGGVHLLTNGSISAAVHWERDDSGRVLCPPVPNATLLSNTGRAKVFPQYMDVMGATNIEALRSWIRESQLDPNDPENADLISLVNSVEGQETPKHFRLIELDDAARFVSDSAFENNRRFHLLSMRQKKHPGVKSKVMPATDDEVTDRMWKSIVAFETEDPYQPPCIVFDEFRSGSKEEREKYMAGIKEMVLKRVREATKEVSLSDVVYNELLPNVVNLKNAITSFFSPRRPLQPKRRTIREAQPSHVHITEASINIRVARAVNVPRRNGCQQLNNRTRSAESVTFRENFELGSSAQGLPMATGQLLRTDFPYMDVPVRPFVEVSFESSVARTTTVTGVNPHWNEELVLALVPPENDFSPVNLSKMNSFLHFNLYDEVVVDILKDERQRSTNIHHRLERKWLGSFSVPFSTLHANSRFEGSVTVNVPPLLLGYSQDQVEGMTTVEGESTLGSCCKTSLKIFVSVEPPLPTLPAIQHKFDSYESTEALMQADLWRRKLKEKFPHRHYQATALNAEGQNVFLTRYISPQNPPEQLLGEGDVASLNLMQRLARFVSLIPNLPDSRFFSRTCDIWTTSDQFLKMLAGDEEEHAILLCNYFLFTCIPSWVVLGNGVPEGSTAYVLSGHPTGVGFLLWDPCTGEHYQQYDPHCPLTTVGCIFDSQNVWGNIQSFDDPGRMNLDVLSGKQWAPLFKDDVPVLSSLQVEDLQYHDSNPDQIGHIEKQLDTLVMNRIQTWRTEKAQITRWNRHATSVLKSALQRCEEKFGTQIEFEDGGFEDLRVLATTYKMSGFPIQVRHNNSEEILEKLKFTGIHLCEDERVEYARAVYIHSYPSDVISIWIYVATLKRD